MKDVVIIEAFTGYPDGKTARSFTPSREPVPLPAEFADLIIAKGHAKEAAARAEAADETEKRSRKS